MSGLSDYMGQKNYDKIILLLAGLGLSKTTMSDLFAIIDNEIEAQIESECDNCDQRMPDEPSYNEGYL